MTTIATNLGTTYFQLSTVGVGALAVGIEDIRQRIYNVLNTQPGTDPFRPLFGSNVYKYNDKPINTAIPNIKKEIFSALDLWMPEIQIKSIAHSVTDAGQLFFNVTYLLVDDDLLDSIIYSNGVVTGDGATNSIIITALVPAKFAQGVYRVYFTTDDVDVLPAIPTEGFQSASDMLTWINIHWSNYGSWYLTENSLVLYLNSGIASKASLIVKETAELTLQVLVPNLTGAEVYDLSFLPNGSPAVPEFPSDINTVEALIIWINTNWSVYGRWSVISVSVIPGIGDYSDDYDSDFDNGNNAEAIHYLVFQSSDYLTSTLTFN